MNSITQYNSNSNLSLTEIKAFQDCLSKADEHQEKGDLESAISYYQEAVKINRESAVAYHNWANTLMTLHRYSEAVKLYKKSLEINPNYDLSYYNLADALGKLNNWESAIIAYQKALNINPSFPDIYERLAHAFYQRASVDRESLLARYRQRIQENPYEVQNYHQAIELQPQDPELYVGLGNALVFNNKIDEAIIAYQMALQIDPNCKSAKKQLLKVTEKDRDVITIENDDPPEVKLRNTKKTLDNLNEIVLNNFLLSDESIIFPEVKEPIVSIILILYNRVELTLACLYSILHNSFKSIEVIIIDNHSIDRTGELLNRIKGATIVQNEENLHFLLASNQASKIATGKYLLFLNNDAQILGNSITEAVKTIESDSDIGAVGGRIILPDGTLQEAGSIIWQDGSCLGYGRGDNPLASQYMFQREVDYCSGAFLLTPQALFEQLEGFDEVYKPAYYEETDYCVRLHKVGKKIIYNPLVTILHYEFASSTTNESAIALQQKNHQTFTDNHQDWLNSQYKPELMNVFLASRRKSELHKILFIDDRVPHPYLGSGYTRGHKILNIMSDLGYTVTFYPTDLSHNEDWQETYHDIPQTVEIAKNWGLQQLESFLRTRQNYYDIVFVSRPHNISHLNYILGRENILAGSKIIYDAEALYCIRDFAYQELKGQPLSEDAKNKAISEELKLATHAKTIISVSPPEKEKFVEYGYSQVEVLGHSLIVNPTPKDFEQRKDILFVGSVYELQSPNADSIIWLGKEIFPLIQKQLGNDIKLYIVGTNQVSKLQQYIASLNNPQIEMLGRVDKLFPFYNRCRLFVAPTRFAAGIPHKVHEASANGLPVVATSAIAEQLQWQNEKDLLVADGGEEFADRCVKLYQDKELWQKIKINALDRVTEQCSPDYFKEKLAEILE